MGVSGEDGEEIGSSEDLTMKIQGRLGVSGIPPWEATLQLESLVRFGAPFRVSAAEAQRPAGHIKRNMDEKENRHLNRHQFAESGELFR